MALEDILGSTTEIRILDFLAENVECAYNQSELSELIGISRTMVNRKIPEMIKNGLIEPVKVGRQIKMYRLAKNRLTELLVAAALLHSFEMAKLEDEDERLREIIEEVGEMELDELLEREEDVDITYISEDVVRPIPMVEA